MCAYWSWMEKQSDLILLLSHQCISGPVLIPVELLYYFWCHIHYFNLKQPRCSEEYGYVKVTTDENAD